MTATIECPEAWDLTRIRTALEAVARGDDVPSALGSSKRQSGYHLQATRILGWTTKVGPRHVPTERGRALLSTTAGSLEERELLRLHIAACAVVNAVAPALLRGGKLEQVARQLEEHPATKLAPTTARKRASTLCKWREQISRECEGDSECTPATSCNRIMIVHLSDIHFDSSATNNPVADRANRIVAAALSRASTTAIDLCCVVVSGDIANKGRRDEYKEADRFLTTICSEFQRRLKTPPTVLVVPGNHDLDFSTVSSVRATLLANVDPTSLDSDYVEECTKVQAPFQQFARRWHADPPRDVEVSTACEVHRLRVGNRTLVFQLLNTAWMSSIKERAGTLVFPSATIEHLSGLDLAGADAVISVFHHPYGWFEPNNCRNFRDAVERTSDVVLTGHEHVSGGYTKERFSGEHNEYLEGGVLQETSSPTSSSFNLLILDLEEKQRTTLTFAWSKDLYEVGEEYPSTAFQRNQYRLRTRFRLDDGFFGQLNDSGEPYAHPRKSPLCLDDFYIYPDVEETELHRTTIESTQKVQGALDFVMAKRQVLVLGGDHAGKTALSKRLFYDLHRAGTIPVLLNARDLNATDRAKVHGRLDDAFEEAFSRDLLERYRQLEPEQRSVIVDDFHREPLSLTKKDALVGVLSEFAETVVLLAGDEIELQAFSLLPKDAELWRFSQCRILELGHLKRYELVRKWCWLGQGADAAADAISREVERKDKALTGLVTSNLAPSIPGVLLLCLQNLELQRNLDSDAGSFGHLYEALLIHNLHQSGSPTAPIDVDAKQKFLSEVAFRLHSGSVDSVDSVDNAAFEHSFDEYKETFHVPYSFAKMRAELVASRLLCERQGQIGFRYKGAYFFFLARYLRDRLQEAPVREKVVSLTEHIHTEKAANVLLFLCHLSKDPFVLDTLLAAARSLFPRSDGSDFETALKSLTLKAKPGTLELDDGDHEEHRREDRETRDQLDRVSRRDLDNDAQSPSELTRLTAAFRTVQLLGQILRGFPGSIDGQRKLEIAAECYSLGARSAHALLSMLVEHREPLMDLLSEVLILRKPALENDRPKLRELAQRLLFSVLEGFCFYSIVQVSDALGNRVLSRTYDEVLKRHNGINNRLIDIAIRLDHFDSLPIDKIDALHKEVRNAPLTGSLLRHLVWRHLYLFPVPFRTRDSICSKLDIKLVPRLIAHTPRKRAR